MEKPTNYFYQYLEEGKFAPTDEEVEIIIGKYVDDHFQELLNALVRRIAKVIKEQYINKNE